MKVKLWVGFKLRMTFWKDLRHNVLLYDYYPREEFRICHTENHTKRWSSRLVVNHLKTLSSNEGEEDPSHQSGLSKSFKGNIIQKNTLLIIVILKTWRSLFLEIYTLIFNWTFCFVVGNCLYCKLVDLIEKGKVSVDRSGLKQQH